MLRESLYVSIHVQKRTASLWHLPVTPALVGTSWQSFLNASLWKFMQIPPHLIDFARLQEGRFLSEEQKHFLLVLNLSLHRVTWRQLLIFLRSLEARLYSRTVTSFGRAQAEIISRSLLCNKVFKFTRGCINQESDCVTMC